MTTMLPEPTAPSDHHQVAPGTLRHVRREVAQILTNTPTYWELPQEARRDIANKMVRVAAYLVDGEQAPGTAGARALDDPQPPPVPTQPPEIDVSKMPGPDITGAAATGGAGALGTVVKSVNFPQFVADLIHGTFDAIVTASIKQMDAYSELLKNVTKSLEEYMRDNVTENNARDYLAQQYPDQLQVDTSGGAPKLTPAPNVNQSALPDFMKDLGLPEPVQSLDPQTVEQTLVPAARQRMALDRQHLLATMVLMGINRLIVTDGDINAKVLFQLDTVDRVQTAVNQTSNFSVQDTYTHSDSGWWFRPSVSDTRQTNFTVATTKAISSQEEIDLHTKLSGEVNVRFRTDAFPLDRMADIIGVDKIGNQQVGSGNNLQTQPAGNREPPPPWPSMESLSPPPMMQAGALRPATPK